MGFISNVAGSLSDSISSEIKDMYLESFRTDTLGQTTLVKRGYPKNTTGLNHGNVDVISAGSKIVVPEGTYAIMVDNGRIIDSVTKPGLYTWGNSSSGSVMSGALKSVMTDVFDRFRFAGEISKIQRLYYINALEIRDQTCNEFLSLPYPDPFYGNLYFKFRLVFSFRIVDPVKFFEQTGRETSVSEFMGYPSAPKMPFLEVRDHMEEALNLCATRDKVPFPKLLSNKSSLKDAVNEIISRQWRERRGMIVESIALTDLTLDEASRERVEKYDSVKMFAGDSDVLQALYVLGLADARVAAASNPAGAATGFMGLGMASSIPDFCPFCGTPLPSQGPVEFCSACTADLRSI